MSIVLVTFRTKYDIHNSTHYIGVIGSVTSLGLWNPQQCLCMTQESPGNWRGSVNLPIGQEFEWKLVLLEESSRNVLDVLRWEERDNRKTTLDDYVDDVDIMVPWCRNEVVTYNNQSETASTSETSRNKDNGHRDESTTHDGNSHHDYECTTKLPKLKTNFANNYFFKNTVEGMMPSLKRKNAIRRKKSLRGDENVNKRTKTNEVISSHASDNTKKSVTFPRIVVTDVKTYDLDDELSGIGERQTRYTDNFYFDYFPGEENTTVRSTENKRITRENKFTTGNAECSLNPQNKDEIEKYPDNGLLKKNTIIDDQTPLKKEHDAGQFARDTVDRDKTGPDEKEIVNDHKDKLKKILVYGTAVTILAASGFACYKYMS